MIDLIRKWLNKDNHKLILKIRPQKQLSQQILRKNEYFSNHQKLIKSESSHSILDIERETNGMHRSNNSIQNTTIMNNNNTMEDDILEILSDELPDILMSSIIHFTIFIDQCQR